MCFKDIVIEEAIKTNKGLSFFVLFFFVNRLCIFVPAVRAKVSVTCEKQNQKRKNTIYLLPISEQ